MVIAREPRASLVKLTRTVVEDVVAEAPDEGRDHERPSDQRQLADAGLGGQQAARIGALAAGALGVHAQDVAAPADDLGLRSRTSSLSVRRSDWR